MTLPYLPKWAPGNYPPGASPWSNQPARVRPGFLEFTPGVSLPADYLNYLIGAQGDYAAAIQSAAANFTPQVSPSGFTTVRAATFDRFRGLWLIGGGTSPIIDFSYGADTFIQGGITAPGGGGTSVVGLGVSPAGVNWYTYTYDGTNFKDWFSNNQGATWTNITTYASTIRHAETVNLGTTPIIALGGTGSTGTLAWYTNADTTPLHFISSVSTATAPDWLLKASTTVAVAIPDATSTITGMAYWTSTTGTSWTAQSFAAGIVDNGDAPTALTWNATLGLFVLAVTVQAGVSQRFCTSPDGVTWTVTTDLTGLIVSTGRFISDLTSVNGLVVGITNDITDSPSVANTARMIYSADGALTWQWSPGAIDGGTTATQRPRIHSNSAQLLAFNSVAVRVSQSVGLPFNTLT